MRTYADEDTAFRSAKVHNKKSVFSASVFRRLLLVGERLWRRHWLKGNKVVKFEVIHHVSVSLVDAGASVPASGAVQMSEITITHGMRAGPHLPAQAGFGPTILVLATFPH